MSKCLILKCRENIILLKLPAVPFENYEIIELEDEEEMNHWLKRECEIHPDTIRNVYKNTVEDKNIIPDILSVQQGDFYIVYKQQDIRYIKADGSYSRIYFRDENSIIVSFRLSDIESKLQEDRFFRIHRSIIINVDYVTRFIGNAVFLDEESFPIGRKFKDSFLERLNVLGVRRGSHHFTDDF